MKASKLQLEKTVTENGLIVYWILLERFPVTFSFDEKEAKNYFYQTLKDLKNPIQLVNNIKKLEILEEATI